MSLAGVATAHTPFQRPSSWLATLPVSSVSARYRSAIASPSLVVGWMPHASETRLASRTGPSLPGVVVSDFAPPLHAARAATRTIDERNEGRFMERRLLHG